MCVHHAAAAKEEAEEANKQRREAAEALKKDQDAQDGSSADADTIKAEDTVDTGSQHVLQVTTCQRPIWHGTIRHSYMQSCNVEGECISGHVMSCCQASFLGRAQEQSLGQSQSFSRHAGSLPVTETATNAVCSVA